MSDAATSAGSQPLPFDMALEIVVVPVADVDRAKDFYANLGWRLDADFAAPDGFRVVSKDVTGLAPERKGYGSFARFSDPDGNGWLLQEITVRLPGR